jgi:cytochrome b involved in lipid metabolism
MPAKPTEMGDVFLHVASKAYLLIIRCIVYDISHQDG